MAVEDYTDYTEVDTGDDRITFTGTNHINHRAERDEKTYLYDDKGAAHFGDFEHEFDAECDYEDTYCVSVVWMLANAIGDKQALTTADEELLYVNFYKPSYQLHLNFRSFDGTDVEYDTYVALANTRYYFEVERSGTTGLLRIYSDSARTTLITTSTVTMVNTTFRYVYACASNNTSYSGGDCDSIIENLDLMEIEKYAPSDIASASDAIVFDVTIPLADDANASDSFIPKVEMPISDDANASDSFAYKIKHFIADTAKATDSLAEKVKHFATDIAKAFDARIESIFHPFSDTAKASDLFEIDIPPLPYPCPTFTLAGTSTNILFPKPEWGNPDNSISKSISLFDFWTGDINTVDRGISAQPLAIGGIVFVCKGEPAWKDLATMTTWLDSIKTAMNNGEKFTINELEDCLNGVYVIKDFTFNTIVGTINAWSWSLNLERVQDV